MKKLAFLLTVVFLTVSTFGQNKTTVKKDPAKQTTKTEQSTVTAKTSAVTTDKTKTTDKTAVDTSKTKLKKDGTPDMRYKDNKTTTTTSTTTKK